MKLLLRSIPVLAFAVFAPFANAQLTTAQATAYTNEPNADNSFENGNNFTNQFATGTVPGANDLLGIFPGFISTPATVLQPVGVLVSPGGNTTITLAAANNHTLNGLLVSGNFESNTTTNPIFNLNFSGSTLTIGTGGFVVVGGAVMNFQGDLISRTGSIQIGSNVNIIDPAQTGGAGTLNLSNGTVDFDNTGLSPAAGIPVPFFNVGDGANGTVNQDGTSTVIVGPNTHIGNNGNGTYNVASGGILDIGTQGAPRSMLPYNFAIGEGSGAVGTMTLAGTLNANNSGTTIAIGDGGTGTLTVTNTGVVNMNSASELEVGSTGTGTFNLAGTLNLGTDGSLVTFNIGTVAGSAGTFNSAGTLIAGTGSTVNIGEAGAGTFNLTAGTADFQTGFYVGDLLGSSGVVNQTGGTLTAEGPVVIGNLGTGSYSISGGTATFSAGMAIGPVGAVLQTGGTVTIPAGQNLDLSSLGSLYSLGGTGILQLDSNALIGTSGEGTLNFAGGTLRIIGASPTFTDALDSSLSNISTIDAATTLGITTVTFAGNLSGPGGLNFEGGAGTTFNFTGNNTYTGSTTISSGTLNATSTQVMDSSSLNTGTFNGLTGTFDLTVATGGFAYAGGITGPGAFNITFATPGDSMVALNPIDATGSVSVTGAGSTLQVYSGTIGSFSGDGNLTLGGAPLVAFPAGTVIPTTGTLFLGASPTATGTATVNSGFLLEGSNWGGNFANNGTITLDPSLPVGSTFDIGGNFTQTLTGAFVARTSGLVNDTYDVAGTADVSGKVVLAGAIPAGGATYTLLSSTGLTTGTLNDPTGLEAVSSFLVHAVLTQVGNDLDVTLTNQPIVGNTPNQNAVAGALNANPNNPIFATINTPNLSNPNFYNFTAADAPKILQELSPQVYQYMRQIAFENATFLVERMNNVDANLRASYGGLDTSAINIVNPGFNTGLGRSMGSLLASNDSAFHQTAPNGVNYYPGGSSSSSAPAAATPAEANPGWDSSSQVISDSPNPYLATQTPSGPETPGFSEFIGGDVILADLNKDSNDETDKASYTAGDASAGVSFRMNSHLAMGVLFDYNHTDAKTDDSNSKTKIDSYTPGIFATYFDHGFYVNGLFAFGYNTYDNTRNMSLFGSTANSSPTGQQYTADIDAGYDFHPDKSWIVGPTLGLTYSHLDVDSFTESGAQALGADLAVQSQSVDSLRSRLGAHAIYQTYTGDVLLQPNISLVWQHEYLDDGDSITSSFADFASTPFSITPDKIGTDSALIGLGMTATLSNSMALYLNYIADVGASDYWAQSVIGGFKARF
jgi:autotransporter-associated beta strand protein